MKLQKFKLGKKIQFDLTAVMCLYFPLHNSRCSKKADTTNLKKYETFLDEDYKTCFKWNMDKDSKEMKYRDLAGSEKVKLFKNINIPSLFPTLSN